MPIPYSNDLRSRAINLLINKKKGQQQVAEIFSVTQATISRWLTSYKINGHCNFRPDIHFLEINVENMYQVGLTFDDKNHDK